MNKFILIICTYLYEVFIYFIWYKKIYKKEKIKTKTLDRSMKFLSKNICTLFRIKLGMVELEDNYEIENLKGHWIMIFNKMIYPIMILLYTILFCPIFLLFIFNDSYYSNLDYIVHIVIYVIFITSINTDFIRKYSQSIFEGAKDCSEIIETLYYNQDIIKKHITKDNKLSFKLKVILAIIVPTSYILACKIYPIITEPPKILRLAAVILLIVYIAEEIQKKYLKSKKYKEKEKKIEIINGDLYRFSDDLCKMCRILDIKDLKIDVICEAGINAYSVVNKNQTPIIKFTSGFMNFLFQCFNKYGQETTDEIFKLILGHELVHVAYKDPIRIRVRLIISSIICLLVDAFLLLMLYLMININNNFLLFIAFLLLLNFLLGRIITDERYWKQISELRADKKGLEVSGVSVNFFDLFFYESNHSSYEIKEIKRINEENGLYKYYKRYVEIEAHPSVDRRVSALNRNFKWGLYDYFEHLLVILKWRITRKGWNGR